MAENDLTARQKRFVQALLVSRSARDAARRCAIGEKTAYRWLRLPQVQSALGEAEEQILAEGMRRLLGLQSAALDELETLLTQQGLTPGERLRAAQIVFDMLLKMRAIIVDERRLAELEAQVVEIQGKLRGSYEHETNSAANSEGA
ncbi:hypothetical protein [Anaerolinea sp.]|uniref:hypothetical protein n=1 Tax=Anaerolinea sp. TaxID=1872519 RepID=UPI002ACDCB8C|nr:hypothetical protein [Anaerolinea sp.]